MTVVYYVLAVLAVLVVAGIVLGIPYEVGKRVGRRERR